MITVGYIISVTASPGNRQVVPAVLKIAGNGQVFFGSTTEDVSTHLFIIRENKQSSQDLTAQLQAVPGFRNVAIVAISKPINDTELSALRELFAGHNWDTSSVTDDELSLFIDDKMLGQYAYYIYLDHKRIGSGTISMRIKRLE